MTDFHTYDEIGSAYRQARKEDPRLAQRILQALGAAETVVNVGAGTGSYEPRERSVIAVEPSMTMVQQRQRDAAPVLRAFAESLPFRDNTFDAGMAILTVHHWNDRAAGLLEMCRVVRDTVVVLTWDPQSDGFWLVQHYFPEFLEADRARLPSMVEFRRFFRDLEVLPIPIPHDCSDGFLGAYWRRPAEYLRAEVRNGISSFATCRDLSALRRLQEDLDNGNWEKRYGQILQYDELDVGYRLIVGRPAHPARL